MFRRVAPRPRAPAGIHKQCDVVRGMRTWAGTPGHPLSALRRSTVSKGSLERNTCSRDLSRRRTVIGQEPAAQQARRGRHEAALQNSGGRQWHRAFPSPAADRTSVVDSSAASSWALAPTVNFTGDRIGRYAWVSPVQSAVAERNRAPSSSPPAAIRARLRTGRASQSCIAPNLADALRR